MQKSLLLATVTVAAIATGACRDPNYIPDPSVEECNIGGPLSKAERSLATSPNPPSIPGRPADCRMGPDGVLRHPVNK